MQVSTMRRAYREQLELIENAIQTERIALQEAQSKQWDALYKQRDKDELTHMDDKFQQINQYESDLKQIILDHQEQYRTTKIQLETDIKLLQEEYELVKATCLMNSEKLDYNHQVLKKREDENKIVRSQQKRRLNKLQDTINAIKAKYLSTKKTSQQEIKKITDEVVHLHDNILDIEIKAEIFLKTNEKTYEHLWSMNRTEAVTLLDQILKIDKTLYEQQLGLEWTPPEKNILYKKDLPSYVAALKMVSKDSFKNDNLKKESPVSQSSEPSVSHDSSAEQVQMVRLLRHVLQKIADNTGFLIERRLIDILKPYTKTDTTLVTLDNVFNALGINSEADILSLREFFIPYVHCAICSKMDDDQLIEEEEKEIRTQDFTSPTKPQETAEIVQELIECTLTKSIIGREDLNVAPELCSSESSVEEQNVQFEVCEIVERVGHFADDAEKTYATILTPAASVCDSIKSTSSMKSPTKSVFKCNNPTHPLELESVFAIRALRDFAAKFYNTRVGDVVTMSARLASDRVTLSRLISEEDVKTYWKRFQEIFGPQKEKLWDSLILGLKKYHAVLKDRSILDSEVCQLRKQNAELKRLLGHYLPTKQKNLLPPIPAHKK